MHFQWYPGHMTKAKRQMQEDIKLIDLVIELVDARIPISSRNPDIDELGKQKARLILMNKADLASAEQTTAWMSYFREKGYFAVKLDARTKAGMKSIQDVIMEACREKIERDRRRGIKNRPVRAMVVGIPNVGKSTFINTYAGKACAKTGNKPGVTKGKQWIRLNKNVELLDTPGILWPKFEVFQEIQVLFFQVCRCEIHRSPAPPLCRNQVRFLSSHNCGFGLYRRGFPPESGFLPSDTALLKHSDIFPVKCESAPGTDRQCSKSHP